MAIDQNNVSLLKKLSAQTPLNPAQNLLPFNEEDIKRARVFKINQKNTDSKIICNLF